jgi:hypothetical protein
MADYPSVFVKAVLTRVRRLVVPAMSAKRFAVAFALATLLVVWARTSGKGIAATEFCPAAVDLVSPVGERTGNPALTYVYELRAMTPRAVSAAIIADTDTGWYTWSVSGVELKRTVLPLDEAISNASSLVTASPPLGVTFSQPVAVRHAWILAALTKGEEILGWDKHGTVPCDVPEFESTSINLANPRSVVSPSPLPSPQGPMPIAAADSPPFAIEKCETPFVEAKRTAIVWPGDVKDFPDVTHGPFAPAIVFIALDGNGRVLDAWLRESTGYAPEDLAALRSARMSTYSGAISYCRHVPGVEADIWTF